MSEVPGCLSRRLITYCTSIHPTDGWGETFAALRAHVPAVKAAVSPESAFPIGLRLSQRAASEVDADAQSAFRDWLAEVDCFVPTLNGFPYGSFHGTRVKENVYLPDWRSAARAAYTRRLADLLADWLPAGVTGSISTVPIGFKRVVGATEMAAVQRQLSSVLLHLQQLRERGKTIILALEPEPGCVLETTAEVCRFFDEWPLPAELRALLGVCYDCCHQAVEFEEPAVSLAALAAAGVAIAKVQVSSALRVFSPARECLHDFLDPCYLHQVVVRQASGALRRYDDLPEALAGEVSDAGDEWRCHFHVPIFLGHAGACGTTRFFLEQLLPLLAADCLLEVETYTWEVLPPELRRGSVVDSIVRELAWLQAQRGGGA